MNEFLQQGALGYGLYLVVLLPIALCNLWLLRTRWLAHLRPPLPSLVTTPRRKLLLGALTALGMLGAVVVPTWLAGGYSPGPGWAPFVFEHQEAPTTGTGLWLGLFFLVQSLFEELLFRSIGMVLLAMLLLWLHDLVLPPRDSMPFGSRTVLDEGAVRPRRYWHWFGAGMLANLIVAGAFGVLHLDNPNAHWLGGVNVVLAGLWLGWLQWSQGSSIWGIWAAHFLWNFSLALLGLPVSGWSIGPGFAGFTGARPGLLTGGAFGPEGSLPCTVVLTLTTGWLIWRSVREIQARQAALTATESQERDTASA